MQAISVFFNKSYLLITTSKPAETGQFREVYDREQAVFAFRMLPQILFENIEGNILVVTNHVQETLESIFDYAQGIVAAGGIVKNEAGETLIIHRKGFWDLPKGKVEKGEYIADAAVREVQEETGVAIAQQDAEPIKTYHCYTMKGKRCIKETYWYNMVAQPGQNKLVPQLDEEITQVKWATRAEMKALKRNFYPLIAELLSL